MRSLVSGPGLILAALLVLQAALLDSVQRPETVPYSPPLAQVPAQLDAWRMVREATVEPEIQEVLKADDVLSRVYARGQYGVTLFVAAFKSQRTGKAPHSPKNCLPGSGWLPLSSGEMDLEVGRPAPIRVNRYVIAHGEERGLVLYWYQSRDRVVAGEFQAKFWVMMDAMRLNRTDTALVRVVVPVVDRNEAEAERVGAEFVRSLYGTLREYLPA